MKTQTLVLNGVSLLTIAFMLLYGCNRDDDTTGENELTPEAVLSKVFKDTELSDSYKEATNHDASYRYGEVNYFGIYPMKAVGSTLYLGLGGLPAGADGAALAKYNEGDASLTYLQSIKEQGVMAFAAYGDGIAVPGADPCCGDLLNDEGESGHFNSEWDWGNFYYIDANGQTVVKHRNLPNTVHGWGAWYNPVDNYLYYAGSGILDDAENKDDATTTGLLFKTNDFGATWLKVADESNGAGGYRTYDVIGIDNRLYIQFNDALSGACTIAKSMDNGLTWMQIPNSKVRGATRLYVVQNHLVALSEDAKSFVRIDAEDQVSTHTFNPLFNISAYHTLSQDPYGNVYVGTTDGRVMHTRDFDSWTKIAHLDDDTIGFNTSTYWKEKQWLVLGNWGDKANLWKIPLINSNHKGLPDILE